MSLTRPSRVFWRYLAFQAPGWIALGALAWLGVAWWELPPWVPVLVVGLWVAKDLTLYPWLRHAYDEKPHDPGAPLVGRTGLARERIDRAGYVRLGGELWRAELAPECTPVDSGESVRVRAVRGLTLVVEPDAGERPA